MMPVELQLPQVLLLDCQNLLERRRLRGVERAGVRVTRVDDARETLEAVLSRPFDLLWVVIGEEERESVLLLEEMQREFLMERLPVVVLAEAPGPELCLELNNLGVRRIFPLACEDALLGEAIFEEIEEQNDQN